MKKLIIILSLITMMITACKDGGKNNSRTTTQEGVKPVILLEKQDDTTIVVKFNPTDMENLPRIMDLYLNYDQSVLKLSKFTKGTALEDAQKELFVNSDQKPGTLRITSLNAANVNRIPAGSLVVLEFMRISDAETIISFDRTRQVFAPARANNQVTFGDDIKL